MINDEEYWDEVYRKELGTGKRRIDNERWEYLVNTSKDYQGKNQSENYKLLDIGCGNGEMLRLFHAVMPDWKLYGLDITAWTINWARGIDPGFNYKVASVYDTFYEANTFEVIFCGETLEHLENPYEAIKEMFRVLKPGGYLICSVPNEGNNRSPEHLSEFTVFDALNLTTGGDMTKLINVNVKCSGISTIWTTQK